MEIIYITEISKTKDIKQNLKIKNIKYIKSDDYLKIKDQFLAKDYLLVIDKNYIKDDELNKIKEGKNPESIVLLSDTLDWDSLIETFKKGETFYLKPVKKEDFEIFE